jgi:hypothetical protein
MHLPRSVAAAGIVLAGMSLVGLLGYVLYGKAGSVLIVTRQLRNILKRAIVQ